MYYKGLMRTGATVLLAVFMLLSFFLVISVQATQANPGILYVTVGGDCGSASPCYSTIQAAVDDSQAGDEIRVAQGMYPIQGGTEQVVLVDKNLTIEGGYTTSNWNTPDPEANATILNALTQGRAMLISGTVEVTIEGLQLIYGSSADLGNGGGIYADGADLTLRQTWVMTNTAPDDNYGGGIYIQNGTLLVDGCTVQANTADSGGGMRILSSDATIQDSLFISNTASGGTSGNGGAGVLISGPGQITMTGNVVKNNETSWLVQGGGVSLYDWGYSYGHDYLNLYLYDNLIEGNYSGGGGGVRIAKSFSYMNISAEIISNTIRDNYSFYGGAGIGAGENITITHNLITENHAGLDPHDNYVDYGTGGGMAIYGNALIENNRITDNEAKGISSLGYGGGAELHGGGSIIFRHNLVTGNYASAGYMGGRGGGIYVTGDNVLIEANLIQGNTANGGEYLTGGGGININGGDTRLVNNIITDNSVSGDVSRGSGVTVDGGAPTLLHNTIANNTGGGGQGIFVIEGDDPGQPVLYNTTVASQTIGIQVDSGSPQNLATLYGVLWWGNTDDYAGAVYAFDETSGDPAFVDPLGWDYHIHADSTAIDKGVDIEIVDDIDSEPRFGIPDLGADEYWAPGALERVYLALVVKNP